MYFKGIQISEWQQFADLQIEFHDRLTVLTGVNGSGKTTLLNLLAKHSGWNMGSLATPKIEKSSGIVRFFSRLWNGQNKSELPVIGNITYSDGEKADLKVQDNNSAQYSVKLAGQKPVKCFYIPSHRPVYRYQPINNIPTTKKNKQTAFAEVSDTTKRRYSDGNEQNSASSFMKNTLVGWAIQGYGVQSPNAKTIMPPDRDQIANYEGFQNVLRKTLPKSLGFQEIEIRNMEVVFICNDGRDEFILETASGGISSIIDMVWQIFMFSTKENINCTVLIDEIENHLHPSMQRQILSDLLSAFPDTKFIVSTHSPLVVGSVKDSSIYALLYNENNKIVSRSLDFDKKAKTAAEILDEVLGVSVTMPLWAETQLNEILDRYSKDGITEQSFNALREELRGIGLDNMIPEAIGELLDESNDQD